MSRVLRSAGETRGGGAGAAGSMCTGSSTVYNSVTVCSFRVRVPESADFSSTNGVEKQTREGTCLVGADHGDGAKRFNRMKLLDNRLALRHAQHAKCECDRCHDRQAFWDGCNRQ